MNRAAAETSAPTATTGGNGMPSNGRKSWKQARAEFKVGWNNFKGTIIWQALANQKNWIWGIVGLAVCNFTISALSVATIKKVFDDAIVARSTPLDPLVVTLIVLACFAFVFGFAMRQVGSRIGYQLEYEMRCWLYE